VNISSVFGIVGWPNHGTYCAAKFAVRGFTEALRHELRGTEVRAVCVHPGGIKTNIVANSRFHHDVIGAGKADAAAHFAKMARTTADEAAAVILKGVEKGKGRILIGTDAWAIDRVQRSAPESYFGLLAKLAPSPEVKS
jgi:short-subunit dehydrogenase